MSLTLNEYQEHIIKTAQFIHDDRVTYCVLGLVGEAGELAEKRKKQLRGDPSAPTTEDIIKELGDVMWYAAALANELGTCLEDVAKINMEKTASRKARGVTRGSGDDR